jgi:hypothetical protein
MDLPKELLDPLFYIPAFFKCLTKADERGISDLVPMRLLPVQEHYVKNRTHRDIILKARQMGMSTGILALNFHHLLTTPYTRMVIIAHREDAAGFLLQTVHRFYNNLPPELQPDADWKSASHIRFPTLDAFVHIDTAQARTIGRAESLNIVHLSEVAQWQEQNATELYAGISQTTSTGGFIVLESTPKGRGGFFYRMYMAAKEGEIPYKAFFYPWWWVPEYQIKSNITSFTNEERLLMDNYGLNADQIAWRRLKISELGELFFQEYPENDTDCWLTSDVSVFDGIALRRYLRNVRPGHQEGNLTIWKGPQGGKSYVIGVDVGAGLPRGDFSVACVLEVKSNEHVATLRGRIAPDLFAEELYRLGKRYNEAMIAVERADHGHTVLRVLLEHNYPNIYRYKDYDAGLGRTVPRPGWLTSGKTRPMMIDTLSSAFKSEDLITYSENLLKEASAFRYITASRAEAPSGEHDDELFAMMIALMVRNELPMLEGFGSSEVVRYV